MKKSLREDKIDIVLLWVDGSDEEWLKKKKQYKPGLEISNEANRFRDWGLLKYWFRGIEKNMSWINKIYFVVDNQKPSWLNEKHPKLKIVNHSDYIDEKYLPLFNSSAIECTINKIRGLSDYFILFNDDMYVLDRTKREDFFVNGRPCDEYVESPICILKNDSVFPHILLNDADLIKKHYSKKKIIKNPRKYLNIRYGIKIIKTIMLLPYKNLSGFHNPHIPQPFLKKSFEMLQKEHPEAFERTLRNRFRSESDITQYAPRYLQLVLGKFEPRLKKIGQNIEIREDNIDTICSHIVKRRTKLLCLNDTDNQINFEKTREKLIAAFDSIYKEKSSFEK